MAAVARGWGGVVVQHHICGVKHQPKLKVFMAATNKICVSNQVMVTVSNNLKCDSKGSKVLMHASFF